jgi:manganese/zinc/iron transport system ATP- binding protein
MNDTPIIEVQNLTVSYHRKPALRSVNLILRRSGVVGIIGPNGAGKSTLLKAVLGLVPIESGTVRVFGEPVERVRRRISYVPQKEVIDWDFPVTVHDVVMMGRYAHLGTFQRPSAKDRILVHAAIDKVDMHGYTDQQIGNLSGGQQQRVFLARALAQGSDILLLDEPFVGVDAATEHAIIGLMQTLNAEGKTVVVVNHDLGKVREYFDYTVLINQRIIAHGPTNAVFTADALRKTYGGRLTILEKTERLFGTAR